MLPESKKKAKAAIKRIEGLIKKLESMIEKDDRCPKILEIALALQGHIKHIQGIVLESHMHTCTEKKLKNTKEKQEFIAEIVKVIGLSKR